MPSHLEAESPMTDRASAKMPRLFESLMEVHGLAYGLWRNDDAIEKWLCTPVEQFNGRTPLRHMLNGQRQIDEVIEWFRSLTP